MTPAEGQAGLVVVNYGSGGLLESHLLTTAADAQTRMNVRIYVVDNFSTAAHRAAVQDLGRRHGWTVIAQEANPGFGAAVNAGFERALADGCDVLMTLNPDAHLDAAVADALATAARAHRAALITPRIVGSDGTVYFDGSLLDLRRGRLGRSVPGSASVQRTWLTAACLVLHASAWQALESGFDDDYFLYWEDVDLSYRAQAAGLSLVVRHDLQAVHDEGGTQGKLGRRKSDTYYRYNCRNRLLFAAKHLEVSDRVRWLFHTPRESALVYLRGGRRQLVSSPGGAVAALHGTVSGVGICLMSIVRALVPRRRDAGRT